MNRKLTDRKLAATRVYFMARRSYVWGTAWVWPFCPQEPMLHPRTVGYYTRWYTHTVATRPVRCGE